ncbi:MAG: ATP-binding protein [Flavobacteriaceae bacterium]|nr:ATP-binding protein [Flavobacteriaceae bacterium]
MALDLIPLQKKFSTFGFMDYDGVIVVDDRGEADYFHGRKKEKKIIDDLLGLSQRKNKGYSILIQGSPGVGKTALLEEYQTEKIKKQWDVKTLSMSCLWDTKQFHDALFGDKSFEIGEKEASGNIKLIGGKVTYLATEKTFSKSLRQLKKPTILIFDEAQMIGVKGHVGQERAQKASELFDELHNARTEHGLVFLIAGLGTTENIFQALKISRFNDSCIINLGVLDKASEKKILWDYLTKSGGVKKTNPHLNHWIEQMTQETHQWAHHISCYGQIASILSKKNNGVLDDVLLKKVLEISREKKIWYYDRRVKPFTKKECQQMAQFLDVSQNQEVFSAEVIIEFLNKTYSLNESERIFHLAVEKGVFHRNKDKDYTVPIPSMRTWLVNQFLKKKKQVNVLTVEELNQRLKPNDGFNPKNSDERKEVDKERKNTNA